MNDRDKTEYPMLAVETTGMLASVALKNSEGKIYKETLKEKLNHLKGLLPLCRKVLACADLDIKDIGTIAVSQGPGSFTGIRIGIATVRSIAQITGAKVMGVPTLETFVYNLPDYRGVVCPVFDARMKQMYGGAFVLEDRRIRTLIKTGAYTSVDYQNMLSLIMDSFNDEGGFPPEFRFFGDGIDVFKGDIECWADRTRRGRSGKFSHGFENIDGLQRATSVLSWAENFGVSVDYSELFPTYVRKAEAQRRLDERTGIRTIQGAGSGNPEKHI